MGLGVERWSDRKQWKIRAMMRRPHSLPISNLSFYFRPFQSCGFYIMCNSDNSGNGAEVRVKRLCACRLKDKRSSTRWSFQICHIADAFNLVVSLCAFTRRPTSATNIIEWRALGTKREASCDGRSSDKWGGDVHFCKLVSISSWNKKCSTHTQRIAWFAK